MKNGKGGRARILQLFEERRGQWIALPSILRLGVAQYNARILALRREGHDIENATEWVDGVKHSKFRYNGWRPLTASKSPKLPAGATS